MRNEMDAKGKSADLLKLKEIWKSAAPKLKIRDYYRLKSKKNEVYFLSLGNTPFPQHDKVIFKKYCTPCSSLEENLLSKLYCSNVLVPKILQQDREFVVLEYIDGQNLCDILNSTLDPKYARMLAEWFAKFHQALPASNGIVTLKGDARLRNFIVRDGQCYGLDFEESHEGSFVNDIAEAAGSIFDTNPGIEDPLFFPAKLMLISMFLNAYVEARHNDVVTKELRDRFVPAFIQILKETAERRGYWDNIVIANSLQALFKKLVEKEIDPFNL